MRKGAVPHWVLVVMIVILFVGYLISCCVTLQHAPDTTHVLPAPQATPVGSTNAT